MELHARLKYALHAAVGLMWFNSSNWGVTFHIFQKPGISSELLKADIPSSGADTNKQSSDDLI